MRKPLVVGNWKMHGSVQSVTELSAALGTACDSLRCGEPGPVEIAVCPPFVYLLAVIGQLSDTGIAVGAQNLSQHQQSAHTGEVCADMLIDLGCRYAIVGHSERRSLYGESNSDVAEKFIAASNAGLMPILCVGETLQQREQGATLEVIANQLQAVIDAAGLSKVVDAVIAYEPVWAIGTGVTATPQQAQEVHAAIRQQLSDGGAATRILYGGSVKSANAAEIFSQSDIDGALVGGASLDANEFLKICQQAEIE